MGYGACTPGPRQARQSPQVMPSRASGRLLSRACCRLAATMLVTPVRRTAPIKRFDRVRGEDDLADLEVVVGERDELEPVPSHVGLGTARAVAHRRWLPARCWIDRPALGHALPRPVPMWPLHISDVVNGDDTRSVLTPSGN